MARNSPLSFAKEWPRHIQSAVLHAISLARVALLQAHGSAARSRSAHVRLRAQLQAARQEIALLQREIEIKDLRMGRTSSRRRPHYRRAERLAILELRAAQGWSRRLTARRFLLQPATLTAWTRRADEGGPGALLEDQEPVNRLPEFVRQVVVKLKALCPEMGKKRIAQTLARAGLALDVSTVGRMLRENSSRRPKPGAAPPGGEGEAEQVSRGPIQARKPNDVWQVGLTVVPTAAGLWTTWFPFSITQVWPFAWWVASVVDQCSRRVLGFEVFAKEPDSAAMEKLFLETLEKTGARPRYVVSDKGRHRVPGLPRLVRAPRYPNALRRGRKSPRDRDHRALPRVLEGGLAAAYPGSAAEG